MTDVCLALVRFDKLVSRSSLVPPLRSQTLWNTIVFYWETMRWLYVSDKRLTAQPTCRCFLVVLHSTSKVPYLRLRSTRSWFMLYCSWRFWRERKAEKTSSLHVPHWKLKRAHSRLAFLRSASRKRNASCDRTEGLKEICDPEILLIDK